MGHSLLAELKRRNVFKAGIAYLALGWVVTQVTSTVAPALSLPGWIVPVVVWIGVIGFPFVVAFSWIYEITPEGVKRESEVDRSASITHVTGRRMDYLIVGLLVLAIGFTAFDRYGPRRIASATSIEVTVPAVSTGSATPPAVPAAAPAVTDNSIAVLPFVNMSSDKEQDFFSDGITEELLNLLAKIPQLQVTARTSSFSFKGKEIGIREIAKTLSVTHILEGSVRKSGNQVRITAQLINAVNDKHLWSETYDRQLDDIFKVQDEIAGKVVEELKVTLLGAAPKARATDPRAYELFLQAKQLGQQSTPDSYAKSDELYRQVLAIDPRYAPAWDELARNAFNEASNSVISSEQAQTRARESLQKALASDPEYAPAHARLGFLAIVYDNDAAAAATHLEHALALDPGNLSVLNTTATMLSLIGRGEDALVFREAIVHRDPVGLGGLYNLGLVQLCAGRPDDAIATWRTVLSLSPRRANAHAQIGLAMVLKGDAQGGLAEIEQEPAASWRLVNLPMAYYALGRKADSDKALAETIEKMEKESAFNIAYVYAFRHEADKTFEWLDKAIEYHDPGLSEILQNKVLFAPVMSDPRWLPFLRKIGRAPEQLAKIEFKVTLPQAEGATATSAPRL